MIANTDDPLIIALAMLAQRNRVLKIQAKDGWKWGFSGSYLESPLQLFRTVREAIIAEVKLMNDQAAEKRKAAGTLISEASDLDVEVEQVLSLLRYHDKEGSP